MPTQYAVVSVAEPERHVHLLTTGAEAATIARQLSQDSVGGARYRVLPITVDDPTEPDWRQREQARFDSGQYTAVPWASESWASQDHFAHVSSENGQHLAYTVDDAAGAADRQTRTLPGRYLERFHRDNAPFLNSQEIRAWVARWATAHEGLTLAFATTEAEIQRVYRNGPNSCMAHSTRAYNSDIHPTLVYAAGDLAVAYLQQEGERVSARCVCWPERRVYGRIYDGAEGRLQMLLEAQGYRRGDRSEDWEGARLLLRRVRDQNRIVVPYLDDPNCRLTADLEAGVLRFDAHGDIYGRSTDGTAHFDFPHDYRAPTPPAPVDRPRRSSHRDLELDRLAARGVMPEMPVVTSAANQYSQRHFDALARFAAAGRWDRVEAYPTMGINTYGRAINRYRDRLLAAHQFQEGNPQ